MSDVSCRHAERLVARAELGDLGEAERMRLELHVQACRDCGSSERRVRGLAELLREELEAEDGASDLAIIGRALLQAGQPAEPAATRVRSRRWAFAAAAAALLVGGIATTAAVLCVGEDAPVARRGDPPAGSEVSPVLAASSALLRPCPGVSARASEDIRGTVTVSEPTRCRVGLDAGGLYLHVDPAQRSDVSIVTPHATVRVVGTVLSVEVEERVTTVTVERGLVDIEGARSSAQVAARRSVRIASGAHSEFAAATTERLAPLADLALELGLGLTNVRAERGETAAGEPAEEPAENVGSETPIRTPASAHRRVRDLRRMLGSETPTRVRSRVEQEMRDPRMARRRGELLTILAEACLADGDFDEALQSYERVWRGPRSSTAANALIAGADVALRRVNEPSRARGLYERYLAEYPDGPLEELAVAGRCRAIAAAENTRLASRCVDEYDARYPNGRFGAQLERLR